MNTRQAIATLALDIERLLAMCVMAEQHNVHSTDELINLCSTNDRLILSMAFGLSLCNNRETLQYTGMCAVVSHLIDNYYDADWNSEQPFSYAQQSWRAWMKRTLIADSEYIEDEWRETINWVEPLLAAVLKRSKHYSGDYAYPVKGGEEMFSRSLGLDMWIHGDYARTRREMFQEFADELHSILAGE